MIDEWSALPSTTDPVHDDWLALPLDRGGERYRLRRAIDDTGRIVRVRERVEEPASRALRVRTRKRKREDGQSVVVRELVEEPEPPEPLATPLALPIVKPPPQWIRERLEASGRWNQARYDRHVAEVEAWKSSKRN